MGNLYTEHYSKLYTEHKVVHKESLCRFYIIHVATATENDVTSLLCMSMCFWCSFVVNGTFVVSGVLHFTCTGRIDRKIEFPLPDEKTRRRIFQIHTKKMTLADDLDLEEYITAKDDLSGADIKVSV